jgi:hypothetical protein
MNRRRVLAALGGTGLAAVAGLGVVTKGPIGYTQAATINDCGNFSLDIQWRETYDGGEGTVVLEDSRPDTPIDEEENEKPSIKLGDIKPGDSGTFCFQIELSASDDFTGTVNPELSFDTPGNWKAENGINEPEDSAGDTTSGDNAGELQNFIDVTLWKDDGLAGIDPMGAENCEQDMAETTIGEGWLSDVVDTLNTSPYSLGQLSEGDTLSVGFAWEFKQVGKIGNPANIAQTDSVTFAFDIYAECPE